MCGRPVTAQPMLTNYLTDREIRFCVKFIVVCSCLKNKEKPGRTCILVLLFVLRQISQQTCPKSVYHRNFLFHGDLSQQTSNNEKLFRIYFFPYKIYCIFTDGKIATYPFSHNLFYGFFFKMSQLCVILIFITAVTMR